MREQNVTEGNRFNEFDLRYKLYKFKHQWLILL